MGSRITAVCSLVVIAAAGVAHCAVAEDGEAPQTAWTCAGAGRVPVALGAAKGIEAWVDCPRTDGWRLEVARDDGEAAGVELVRVRLMSDRPAKRPRFEIGFRKADGGRVRTMWRATMGKRTFDTGDALPLRAHASFASSFAFSRASCADTPASCVVVATADDVCEFVIPWSCSS